MRIDSTRMRDLANRIVFVAETTQRLVGARSGSVVPGNDHPEQAARIALEHGYLSSQFVDFLTSEMRVPGYFDDEVFDPKTKLWYNVRETRLQSEATRYLSCRGSAAWRYRARWRRPGAQLPSLLLQEAPTSAPAEGLKGAGDGKVKCSTKLDGRDRRRIRAAFGRAGRNGQSARASLKMSRRQPRSPSNWLRVR